MMSLTCEVKTNKQTEKQENKYTEKEIRLVATSGRERRLGELEKDGEKVQTSSYRGNVLE